MLKRVHSNKTAGLDKAENNTLKLFPETVPNSYQIRIFNCTEHRRNSQPMVLFGNNPIVQKKEINLT